MAVPKKRVSLSKIKKRYGINNQKKFKFISLNYNISNLLNLVEKIVKNNNINLLKLIKIKKSKK